MGGRAYHYSGRVTVRRESWRDVAASYLVHRGLQLASVVCRREILDALAAEREQAATTARPVRMED